MNSSFAPGCAVNNAGRPTESTDLLPATNLFGAPAVGGLAAASPCAARKGASEVWLTCVWAVERTVTRSPPLPPCEAGGVRPEFAHEQRRW